MSYRIGDWFIYYVEKNQEWVARSQGNIHTFSTKKEAVNFVVNFDFEVWYHNFVGAN
tara:strand:+ start:2463 stop:2633 length:171 start_codon:yes stop_codon:yes gene_type:complete